MTAGNRGRASAVINLKKGALKNFADGSDDCCGGSMTSLLHQIPGSTSELDFFARLWEWERTVKQQLDEVLKNRTIYTVFQPIFRLSDGRAQPCGYEALSRFPTAPRVPVGLWFRIAREMDLDYQLETLATHTAVDSCTRLPADHFLTINASLPNAIVVAEEVGPRPTVPMVVDVPYRSIHHDACKATFETIRASGTQISLDDTPLEQLHELRPAVQATQPEYLKVDVLTGLFDNPMGRFNLAEAAAWCCDAGITLVAERVEKPEDLQILYDLGVEMAQGYSLARPA